MRHQKRKNKLNKKPPHRRALLRNAALTLIEYGQYKSTKTRVKALQQFIEKLVTKARPGDMNAIRYVNAKMASTNSQVSHKKALMIKLFKEIAPRYANRDGGYTRVTNLGQRSSDTAKVATITWV